MTPARITASRRTPDTTVGSRVDARCWPGRVVFRLPTCRGLLQFADGEPAVNTNGECQLQLSDRDARAAFDAKNLDDGESRWRRWPGWLFLTQAGRFHRVDSGRAGQAVSMSRIACQALGFCVHARLQERDRVSDRATM